MSGVKEMLPFTGLSRRKRAHFYQMLAQVLDAGIPPLRSMDILIEQSYSKKIKSIAQNLKAHIQDGGSVTSGLKEMDEYFPEAEVNMLASAEYIGILPQLLTRLADFLTYVSNSFRSIIVGLIYPAILLFVAFVFIPVFQALFLGGMEDVVQSIILNTITLLVSILLIVIVWKFLNRLPGTRYMLHGIILYVPIVGGTLRQLARARFARMYECLHTAGISVFDALPQAADACGNAVLARRLHKATPLVRDGAPLAQALKATNVLTPLGVGMLEVGEESGNMETPLKKFVEHEEQQVEAKIQSATRLLPVLIYLLVAGYIVFYIIIPAFQNYLRMLQI